MTEAPLCPQCGRPLQHGRSACIYCGRELSRDEMEHLDNFLDDEAVRQRLAEANALLESGGGPSLGSRGRLIVKVVVIFLSLLAFLFISWLSGWEPVIIGLSVIIFALPIWQVLRKL